MAREALTLVDMPESVQDYWDTFGDGGDEKLAALLPGLLFAAVEGKPLPRTEADYLQARERWRALPVKEGYTGKATTMWTKKLGSKEESELTRFLAEFTAAAGDLSQLTDSPDKAEVKAMAKSAKLAARVRLPGAPQLGVDNVQQRESKLALPILPILKDHPKAPDFMAGNMSAAALRHRMAILLHHPTNN